ncbi:MAG TPA: SpoIIE family protein phosphatase [Candidatus Limnocylindria bacterium]|jgi:PAS domain S-box-containing protein|nr:SpoIIE family protein phosphatase [Candidatus Limnocylindria bacterium]
MEVRAVENFAAAPATRADRRSALLSVLALIVLFVVSIPFARTRLGVIPAFLPAVVGAGIVASTLTTLLLYLQYRIERDLRLALLYVAYGYAAITQLLYILTFPGLFSPGGMLGAGPQTSAAFFLASQLGFCVLILAQGLAARFDWQLPRNRVRLLVTALVVLTLALALLFTLGHDLLPSLVEGERFSALDAHVLRPALVVVSVLALVVVGDRWRTVTQTWLSVVLLARAMDVFTTGELSGLRFSAGWYTARMEGLLASIVILAVFLVKYNGLMLRLAARSRSTAEALEIGEARYASLTNVVPQLIFTAGAQGDLEYVNDRWSAYTGQDLDQTRVAGWRGVFHPDHDMLLRDRWLHALRTGEAFSAECRIRETSGRYRWFLVNVAPVRGRHDETMAWIGTCTDIDSQKRLEEREAFLARAGERLGASLDVNATVAGIKALVVPRLADRCWISLVDDEGGYALSGIGSSDVAEELEMRRWIGSPLPPAAHDAVAEIVRHGEPIVADERVRFPDAWLCRGESCATMVVPLVNGDLAVGALAIARDDRPYDADDVGVVREFARRAALSLRHARLYLRERTTADALQRAMLPAQLPLLADVRFSASYSAASESQRVGGDFYDAFELPDGRVALTIGDVTGHGLEAAVIMGEIRQALRAASFERAEPSLILDRASRLLVASGRTVFVTAIFGVFDPVSGRFSYATAGHPPPILEQTGILERLPSTGLPIGLRDGEGVDFGRQLHAPCTLVLYTDGLLEFGRDIEEGERRIDAAMRELAHEQTEHLAAALMKAVLADDEATDDIAILTVSIDRIAQPLRGESREWRFSTADARTGAAVRREVGNLVTAWTGRDEIRFASELAYGELIANVVRYAPGIVRVEVSSDADGNALLVVDDQGAGFVPAERSPDPFSESGRGLQLVEGVADGMAIESSPSGGTRVRVTFLGERAVAA